MRLLFMFMNENGLKFVIKIGWSDAQEKMNFFMKIFS